MFESYAPKIRAYSIIINLTTHTLLAVAFQSCGYEDISTKIYSRLGVNIGESFCLQMHIIEKII